jgi:hypothetical protein
MEFLTKSYCIGFVMSSTIKPILQDLAGMPDSGTSPMLDLGQLANAMVEGGGRYRTCGCSERNRCWRYGPNASGRRQAAVHIRCQDGVEMAPVPVDAVPVPRSSQAARRSLGSSRWDRAATGGQVERIWTGPVDA